MCWLKIDNRDTYSTGGQASSGEVDGELDMGTFGTGLQERCEPGGGVGRKGRRGGGLLASNPEVVDRPVWLHAAVAHRPQTPGARLVSAADPAPSAALNVLFDDDAAVSEERTG